MLAALLTLALAAGPAAPPPLEVLEAGEVEYDTASGRGLARGGVVLRRGVVLLRSETAAYDTTTGEVDAEGSVLLTEPGRAVSATRLHAVLDGAWTAHDVVAFLKATPLDLSRCRTIEEARAQGGNRLTLRGEEVRGASGQPEFELDHARLTLCDCGGGAPSWEIRGRHASVTPGRGAWLTWPVIYVTPRLPFVSGTLDFPVLRRIVNHEVPVLALPVLYLPLGERQSGLLFPVVDLGTVNAVAQPVYVTLGRSWDATISPQYNLSGPSKRYEGLGGGLELRWAPAEGAGGYLRFNLLHAAGLGDWPGGFALPPGGNRMAISGVHDQRFSDATFFRAELGVIGDPLYLQDFTADALLRAQDYRRSAVALTHRTDDLVLEADASYNLPLTHLDGGAVRAPFGPFGGDLSTFHRLPSASVSLLPTRVLGAVRAAGTLSVARFAPLRGATGDEGADGIGPGDRGWGAEGIAPDAGERDGRWQGPSPGGPGERLAATRLLGRLELSAPVSWRALVLEPWAAATVAGYSFEAGPNPQADARASGGVALSTQLTRTFGSGAGRVAHVVEPRVEWRGGTGQAGPGLPSYAYDELDVALPPLVTNGQGFVTQQRTLSAIPSAFSQLRLTLRNRLVAPSGPLSSASVEVTLGQDLDAAAGRASETWAQGALHIPHLSLDARAGFRAFGAAAPVGTPQNVPASTLDAFTELSLGATVFDARGDNLHASFIALASGASPRVVAGLEPFFDPRPVAADAVALGSFGAATHLGGASVVYDALFYGRELASAPVCAATGAVKSREPHVYQHQVTMVWDSPCHCWRAGIIAVLNECDSRPQFHFTIDLSSIASGATAVAR